MAKQTDDTLPKSAKNTLYCNFCGKSQREVHTLIAGATAFICDQCVDTCIEYLAALGAPTQHYAVRLTDTQRQKLAADGITAFHLLEEGNDGPLPHTATPELLLEAFGNALRMRFATPQSHSTDRDRLKHLIEQEEAAQKASDARVAALKEELTALSQREPAIVHFPTRD